MRDLESRPKDVSLQAAWLVKHYPTAIRLELERHVNELGKSLADSGLRFGRYKKHQKPAAAGAHQFSSQRACGTGRFIDLVDLRSRHLVRQAALVSPTIVEKTSELGYRCRRVPQDTNSLIDHRADAF